MSIRCFLFGHRWAKVHGTAIFWCRRCPELRNIFRGIVL